MLSGGDANLHKIQGIGAGFIPKLLNRSVYDEIITVSSNEAIKMAKTLSINEGLLVGISSGANVAGAKKIASKYPNKRVVTILPDSAERYISTELFEE